MKRKSVQIDQYTFDEYISELKIKTRVEELGHQLAVRYNHKNPIFLGILNGSFMFMADLVRATAIPCEVNFVQISSYIGTASERLRANLSSMTDRLKGRHIIVVEDIVDTGNTLHFFMDELKKFDVASSILVTLLVKPDAINYPVKIDYEGFSIPNDFVIGYGLDYDQKGRELEGLYRLKVDKPQVTQAQDS